MERTELPISWNSRSSDWKNKIGAEALQMMYAVAAGASATMVGALFQRAVFDNADRIEKVPQQIQTVFGQPLSFISKCKQDLTQTHCIILPQPASTGTPLYLLLPLLGMAMFFGYRLGRSTFTTTKTQTLIQPENSRSDSGQTSSRSMFSRERETTDKLLRFADREVVSAVEIERKRLVDSIQKKMGGISFNKDLISNLIDVFSYFWYNRHRDGGWFIHSSVIVSHLQEKFPNRFSENLEDILGSQDWWIEDSKGKLLKASYLPEFIIALSQFLENPESMIRQSQLSGDGSSSVVLDLTNSCDMNEQSWITNEQFSVD